LFWERYDQDVAQLLRDTSRSHVYEVRLPDFHVPLAEADGPQMDFPYVSYWNRETGTYRGGSFQVYISQPGNFSVDAQLHDVPTMPPSGGAGLSGHSGLLIPENTDGNVELDHHMVSTAEAMTGTKSLVVPFSFVQAGYWGHLMDNGHPRMAFVVGAAKRAGYDDLYFLVSREDVVHGDDSLQGAAELSQRLFGAKFVIRDTSAKSDHVDLDRNFHPLPAACAPTGNTAPAAGSVCRFMFVDQCELSSFHEIPRRRMYQLGQQAISSYLDEVHALSGEQREELPQRYCAPGPHTVDSHGLSVPSTPRAAEGTTAAPAARIVLLSRGAGGANSKGDAFSTSLEEKLAPSAVILGAQVSLEKMPLMEIAATVHLCADVTMGVEGSNMYHMIWSRPRHQSTIATDRVGAATECVGSVIEMASSSHADGCRWLWGHLLPGYRYDFELFAWGDEGADKYAKKAEEALARAKC